MIKDKVIGLDTQSNAFQLFFWFLCDQKPKDNMKSGAVPVRMLRFSWNFIRSLRKDVNIILSALATIARIFECCVTVKLSEKFDPHY